MRTKRSAASVLLAILLCFAMSISCFAAGTEQKISETVKGFGGDIELVITVAEDGTVAAVEVISNSETPALGGAVLSEDFLKGVIGAASSEDFDAMSGATITSTALKEAVDAALAEAASAGEAEEAKTEEPAEAEKETAPAEAAEQKISETVKGFGGDIELVITVAEDGTVAAVEVISNSETPALGGAVLSEDFLKGVIGAASSEDFDAMSGATITSTALKEAVDAALAEAASAGTEASAAEEAVEEKPEETDVIVDKVISSEKNADGTTTVDVTVIGCIGEIELQIVLDDKGAVSAISVAEDPETPALGGKVLDSGYLAQYTGNTAAEGVDAMSGATVTSEAVARAVAMALEQF